MHMEDVVTLHQSNNKSLNNLKSTLLRPVTYKDYS